MVINLKPGKKLSNTLSTKIVAGNNSSSKKFFKPAVLGLVFLFGISGVAMAAPLSELLQASDEAAEKVAAAVDVDVPTASMEIHAEVQGNSSQAPNSNSSVEVRVNGEEVPINQNGTTHEVIETENGSNVTVEVDASGCDISSSVRVRSRSSTNSQSTSQRYSSATSSNCSAD